MNPKLAEDTDRTLIAALPLPLAQAWRRARYADSPGAEHERALYMIEATLKFAASAAVMSWIARGAEGDAAKSACSKLVRPSAGHWVGMLRECLATLPDDHPASRWLNRVLSAPVENQVPDFDGRKVQAVLDAMPAYRNKVAHGSGLSADQAKERAPLLLALARQVASTLVGDDAPRLIGRAGSCTVQLTGPTAIIAPVDGDPPTPALLLRFADRLLPLAPLWVFDTEEDDVLVMNKGAGLPKVEYLSYGSPRGGAGLATFRGNYADFAKWMLETITGEESLDSSAVESLINETAVSELASLATSIRYGPFRVVRKIASGGQGVLYEAIQEDPPRRVALKTLSIERALSEDARRRLKEEAAALAKVEHPSVVTVYEAGDTDGVPWIAMKYVEGKSFAQILDELRKHSGTLTVADWDTAAATTTSDSSESRHAPTYAERIVALFRDAAQALAACHANGVVHRDVTSGNLMLDSASRVVLTDFGLARSTDPRTQTFTRQLVGTLQYLAPEALVPTGRAGPDARVDVYGLGAVLYEALALRRPFADYEKDKTALLHAVQTKEVQPLRRVAPWVPRDLHTVVMKAIERDRDRRYRSASEFADDLGRFLEGEPVRAKPAGPIVRTRKWVRKHPAITALMVAAVCLVVGLSLWARAEHLRQSQAERQANRVEQDVAYIDGALKTTLGLDRQEGETALDAEMLQDARRLLDQSLRLLDTTLQDSDLRDTSAGQRLEQLREKYKLRQEAIERLATFYRQADNAWFHIGAEQDEAARVACEAAVRSLGALEHADWPARWKTRLDEAELRLRPKQVEQLKQDAFRQLILLSAIRAKPAAVNFLEPPDAYIRSAREALSQADRIQPSGAGALVDWFCRMRLGETDLPRLPDPETATDFFFLGITHFWIARFPQSSVGDMVLSQAPEGGGLDLKNAAEASIRNMRTACNLDPHQYWHHFSLAWALNALGEGAIERAEQKPSLANKIGSLLSGGRTAAAPIDWNSVQQNSRDAELATNNCITLRPRFPRGYELRGQAMILQSVSLRRLAAETPDPETDKTAVNKEADRLEVRGLADFDVARNLNPKDADVYWSRAHSLELLGRNDKAVEAYATAMQMDRPLGRLTGQQWVGIAHRYFVRLTADAGHRDNASAWATFSLANLLLSRTDDERRANKYRNDALKAANRALQLRTDEPRALAVRGTVFLKRGDTKAAIAEFDAALAAAPDSYLAASGKAKALQYQKQYAAALAAWQQILQRKDKLTNWQLQESLLACAEILEKLDRHQEAEQAEREAATLRETDAGPANH